MWEYLWKGREITGFSSKWCQTEELDEAEMAVIELRTGRVVELSQNGPVVAVGDVNVPQPKPAERWGSAEAFIVNLFYLAYLVVC